MIKKFRVYRSTKTGLYFKWTLFKDVYDEEYGEFVASINENDLGIGPLPTLFSLESKLEQVPDVFQEHMQKNSGINEPDSIDSKVIAEEYLTITISKGI